MRKESVSTKQSSVVFCWDPRGRGNAPQESLQILTYFLQHRINMAASVCMCVCGGIDALNVYLDYSGAEKYI